MPAITMRLRHLLVTALMASVSACGSPGVGSGHFFDSRGTIETAGWDMQAAKFSPDGNHLGVIAVDPSGQWLVGTADSGHVDKLALALDGKIAKDFAWMPDSQSVLVAVNDLGGTSTTKIVCVRLDGATCSGVNVPGAWHHSNRGGMNVSPDGTKLAIQGFPGSLDNDDNKPSLVYVMTLASPTLTTLSGDVGKSKSGPVWLDSDHLVAVVGDVGPVGAAPPHGRLLNYTLGSTSAATPVTPDDLAVETEGSAPGGVVYRASAATSTGARGIYVYEMSTGKSRLLGDFAGDSPTMAPDGSYFLYSSLGSPTQDAVITAVQLT